MFRPSGVLKHLPDVTELTAGVVREKPRDEILDAGQRLFIVLFQSLLPTLENEYGRVRQFGVDERLEVQKREDILQHVDVTELLFGTLHFEQGIDRVGY